MASRVQPIEQRRIRTRTNVNVIDNSKKEFSLRVKRIAKILNKPVEERNGEELKCLNEDLHLIPLAEKRIKRTVHLKDKVVEKEDPIELLKEKCLQLAEDISKSKCLVVYTGAGISTSANIPDYRSPNGVWSQLNRNKKIINVPLKDLACAEPTFTHLALTELLNQGYVKHLVSQNCDGLHIRSGFPCKSLSEVHGNMFLEVCSNCSKLYWRDFDVTEKTSFHRHRTGRFCHDCDSEKGILMDTIVHFGEKSHYDYPYNWSVASKVVESTDMILCLGTSLAVLRKYKCLWPKKQSTGIKTKLCIVNLQWTPKDSQATLKINGKCDDVMKTVCEKLSINVPSYNKLNDPLLQMKVPLKNAEQSSHNRLHLSNLVNQDSSLELQDSTSNYCKPGWFGKGLKAKRR